MKKNKIVNKIGILVLLSILSKIVQTPRAGLFVPPYFIHFFKERGVCYEKIFKDFYFP